MNKDTKFFIQSILVILLSLDISDATKEAIDDLWNALRAID